MSTLYHDKSIKYFKARIFKRFWAALIKKNDITKREKALSKKRGPES